MTIRLAAVVLLTATSAACAREDDTPRVGSAPKDTIRVVMGEGSGAAPAPVAADTTPAALATDVVSRYYRNIDTGNLRAAYDLLGDSPERPSYEDFAKQQEPIANIRAATREAGRIEGAAGSQYIEVPATVATIRKDGSREKTTVVHTLRRSMVDGATAAQRSWRISSVKVSEPR